MRIKSRVADNGVGLDNVEIDLSIRLTVEDARNLMRQQGTLYPSSRLGNILSKILGDIVNGVEHLNVERDERE